MDSSLNRPPTPPPSSLPASDEDLEGDLTRFLSDHRKSRSAGTEAILPHVYTELRRIAAARLQQENRGHTLQPTALVHEAYLRLVSSDHSEGWENRRHFFAAAAEAMRRILIDHARHRLRKKRQASAEDPLPVIEWADESALRFTDLLALDEALSRLEAVDARKARIVELKFFAGLAHAEIAELLGLSLRTLERQWRFTRAWLHREIEGTDPEEETA